jgi:hypothetical protein
VRDGINRPGFVGIKPPCSAMSSLSGTETWSSGAL